MSTLNRVNRPFGAVRPSSRAGASGFGIGFAAVSLVLTLLLG
jgi:hypothetical protein